MQTIDLRSENPDVEVLSTIPDEEYRDFLLSDPRNLFYVTPEYRDLIAEETDSEPVYFCYRNSDGDMEGILPTQVYVNEKYGPVVNSLPYYGSNGGIVLDPDVEEKPEVAESLLKAFKDFCRTNGVISSTLIENPLKDNTELYNDVLDPDFHDERIGQITFFPDCDSDGTEQNAEDRLMEHIEPVRRRNIRKARKSNVDFYTSTDREDLQFLADLHHEHMEAINGNEKSGEFFRSIPDFVDPDNFTVYVATYNGDRIAGLLLFYFNRTVEYYTPAYDIENKSKQAPSLLVFEAMKDAFEQGYKNWNWGGTWKSQSGVYDYKKRWGTEDFPYRYHVNTYGSEEKLLGLSSNELAREYEGFYVVPYEELDE